MKRLLRDLLVLLVVGILSIGLAQPVQAAPNDVDLLRQSVTAWEKGWSSGDNLFSMDLVDRLYDRSDRFLEFDTISPAGTVTQGYQSYKDLWEPIMQASKQAKTAIDDNVKVTTEANLSLPNRKETFLLKLPGKISN